MPVTTLDPITALIVIDLQAGLAHLPTAHPFDDVVANAVALAAAFPAKKLPAVLVNVETTARQAYEHGFNVTLATDAMTDTDPALHDNSVTRVFPKLGETGTTSEILELLQ